MIRANDLVFSESFWKAFVNIDEMRERMRSSLFSVRVTPAIDLSFVVYMQEATFDLIFHRSAPNLSNGEVQKNLKPKKSN